MNYVELHIGDYEKATAHLTACEDGIYGRLMRRYYDTEAPLPADLKAVQRLVRARSKDEREAVDTVLHEFFQESPEGWRHGRCDAEIARYAEKRAKAKRSAEARWNGCERIANASDGQGAKAGSPDGETALSENIPSATSISSVHDDASPGRRNANEINSGTHANALRTHIRAHSEGNARQSPVTSKSPEPNGSGADAPPIAPPPLTVVDSEPPADPIWGTGLAFLIRKGIPKAQARSLLGLLRKQAGDIQTGAILADAEAKDISDPAPWLMRAAANAKPPARGSPGQGAPGKTMQALQALEDMKNGLAGNRNPDGLPETALLEFGSHARR